MTVRLKPCINFRGNAREAMAFYQGVLGGELRMSTTWLANITAGRS
jgi:PhnB protein